METQASVCLWADQTFGTAGDDLRIVARAHEELSEMLRKITTNAPAADIAEEAADVMIILCRVGQRNRVDLEMQPPLMHASLPPIVGIIAAAAAGRRWRGRGG